MIVGINDALKAIAYALLVLFFVIGVMKTCGSFTELKRPEVAFKCFIRFVLAQAAVTYGMELMTALFSIAQGAIQTIMGASGLSAMEASTLPAEIATTIEDRSKQPAPNTIINMARPPLESLCHVSLEQGKVQGSILKIQKNWRDSSSK